jgi:hypothetical protein
MDPPMGRRRIIPILCTAGGGLLGAALIPVAVAFADSYSVIPDPSSTETLTGIYGLENTAPPAVTASLQGYQEFEVIDTTTGKVVGTFDADEAKSLETNGDTNEVLLVTHDLTGTVGTASGDTPAVGSVYDMYGEGGGFGNDYSDLVSTKSGGADVISYASVSPFGSYASPEGYDAAAAESLVYPHIGLAGGYTIEPVPDSTDAYTAISGFPPDDIAIQGTQEFEVVNAAGTVVGTFDADVTTTSDTVNNDTQELLVTQDLSGTPGTAAGDVPAVGSVFNTFVFGDTDSTEIYSDLVSTTPGGADVISDVGANPFGQYNIPTSFDAAAYESPSSFSFDGDTIAAAPGSTEVFTGVNGLPPADVAVQGYQLFDVVNPAGKVVGTFDADVTTSDASGYGTSTETLLVTNDVSGTSGTAAGDIPPVGSVFDVSSQGASGYETVYSDLASTTPGADVISDTWVTPFGDFPSSSSFDLAAGLASDMFQMP